MDVLALLAASPAHGLGLLTGPTIAAGARTGRADSADKTAGVDLPSAVHESSGGLMEFLNNIVARQANFILDSVNREGACSLRLLTVDVVNKLPDYLLSHAGSLLTLKNI